MAGHDNSSPQYIVRLPDRFWQRIVDLKYFENNAHPNVARTFNQAVQGKLAGGHARYIKGTQRQVCDVLAQLHLLASECRAGGQYRARKAFGTNRSDIERMASQRIRLAADVHIIDEPGTDIPEGE